MAEGILALLIAFALGSIPTAFVSGKLLSGGDIRESGSGNPGTLNAVRQYGKLVGLVVLLVDAGKGILAVIIAQAMSVTDIWIYGTALLATLGHNFSRLCSSSGAARERQRYWASLPSCCGRLRRYRAERGCWFCC